MLQIRRCCVMFIFFRNYQVVRELVNKRLLGTGLELFKLSISGLLCFEFGYG